MTNFIPWFANNNLLVDIEDKELLITGDNIRIDNDIVDIEIYGVRYEVSRDWIVDTVKFNTRPHKDYVDALTSIRFYKHKNITGLDKTLILLDTPVETKRGYFLIASHPGYAVNKDGDILNLKTGAKRHSEDILESSRANVGDTYPTIYFYDKRLGYSAKIYMHIILASAFNINEDPTETMYVDHIDGNKFNFNLNNLEWVSPSENITRYHKNRR